MAEETTEHATADVEKLESVKQQAGNLGDQLDVLNAKKEAAFTRKQEFGGKISEKIRQVNEFKQQRNDLTKQVRDLKVERDALNNEISVKIAELKALQPAKDETAPPPAPTPSFQGGRYGERLHPREIERRMKALEQKIETVPMSFEAEQKTMKEIKQLKKQLDAFGVVAGQSKELVAKSKEIDKLKKAANALHANVTQLAKQSQDYHEKILTISKEIEDLRTSEDAAQEEFFNAKKEFVALAGDAREARTELSQAKQVLREHKEKEKRQKAAEDQKTLQQRAKDAEDKMMRGEKLTTEDLLAMQSVRD